MLLKFFKRPLPSVFITMLFIAILLWLQSFLLINKTSYYFEGYEMPFYSIIRNLAGGSSFIERIFAFIVLIASSLYLIQLNTKHILIKYRTYLPTLLFVILSSSFLPLQKINPGLFAAFFLILSIDNLFSAYESSNHLDRIFKASLFTAIASLFYFPTVFFLALIIISLFILRFVSLRDWIVALVGFITPWFFVFFYNYFFKDDLGSIQSIIAKAIEIPEYQRFYGISFTIFYSYAGLLLIITTLYLLKVFPTQKIITRKNYSIFIWFIILSAAIAFLVGFSSIEIIYLASIPTTFFFSNFFTFSRSRLWPEFLFSILVVLSILMQFT